MLLNISKLQHLTTSQVCSHVALRAASGGVCPVCAKVGKEHTSPPIAADVGPPPTPLAAGATSSHSVRDPGSISVVPSDYKDLQVDSRTTEGAIDSRRTEATSPAVTPASPAAGPDAPAPAELRADARQRLTEIQLSRARRIAAKVEILRQARARRRAPRARKSLAEFTRQAWEVLHPTEPLVWNWHLDVLCDHAQALMESLLRSREQHRLGRALEMPVQNLLINVPPRTGKTEVVGVFLPCWLWLKDPSLNIRYVSGNDRVRTHASRMSRDLIDSTWYRESFLVGWQIRGDADAVELYENTARGRRYNSSYEQKITGEGTDVIIVDDPIDAAKASSEIERTGVNARWDLAIENRVDHADRCARIGIMQRLHEEDWSAHVLAKGTWRHVCLPTEFERRDVEPYPCPCADCRAGASFLGRYDRREVEGEILHPARMSERRLGEERTKGALYYAGQHQQRPAPAEGGMFKRHWWGSFNPEDLPSFRRVCIFMDCSAKKTVTGSRTAIGVIGEEKMGPRRYVLDVVAKPMDITDMKRALVGDERMKNIRAPFAPGTFLARWPRATLVVEDKAAGSDLIVELKAAGINVIAWDPKNSSKESRAFSIVGTVEAGNVLLPKGAPWKDGFLHELSIFPNGKWDDQMDMLSMGLSYLRDNMALKRTHL